MPPVLDIDTAKKITEKIRQIVRFLRHSPRETIAVFAGLALGSIAWWLGQTDQPKQLGFKYLEIWQIFKQYGSLTLFIFSGLSVLWAFVLIWRRLTPPPEEPVDVRPSAIKGPMPFGPHDGVLFRRLGREGEIGTLLDWILDEQIGLIIVMGESGAGKTSLLRAGLHRVLENQSPPIEYHYWEAVPDKPVAGLLTAVQAGWAVTADTTAPQKLTDLYPPSKAGSRRVIVLDQFEQLSPSKKPHQPIFQLLRHVATTAMPPHSITYVVAFRRDYDPTWRDFEIESTVHRQTMMSLRLFSEEQAKDIIAIIAEAAHFTLDNALADDLIVGMRNDEDRISPVDIGITLLALNERALRKPERHLNRGDYRIAGGATGLLVEYASSRLDRYRPDEQNTILKALLELVDLDTDRRLAEGLTLDRLAEKTGSPTSTLQRYLHDLASPHVRLLELLPSGAYRLPHERLIPALRQLSGFMLAEAEQANRTFNLAYVTWVSGRRSRALLLHGRRLRDVVRQRNQLHWGADRTDKQEFLRRSCRRRNWQRTISGAVPAGLLILGYLGLEQLNRLQYQRDLAGWGQPAALYDYQGQLKTLSITNDRLTHLRWLRSSFNELSFETPKLSDLEGLEVCKSLVFLTLNLNGSRGIGSVDALKDLKGLTSLTLNLGSTSVGSLDALKELKSLKNLTLNLSREYVNLSGRIADSLDVLKDLKGLTSLTLDLSGSSNVGSLDALEELEGLTNLKLDLRGSYVGDGSVYSLPLKRLKDLTSLTLNLIGSRRTPSLDALKDLTSLTSLTLDLGDRNADSLDVLKDLKGLTNLTLDLSGSSVGSLDVLKDLKGLTNLTLDLSGSSVGSLDALKDLKGLTNLTLDLSGTNVGSLDALKDFKGLASLTLNLSDSKVRSLDALKDLKGLISLTLYLTNAVVDSLEALKDLTLNLTSINVGGLDALRNFKDLKGLTSLTLNLSGANVGGLDALKDLESLTSLTLNLSYSNLGSVDVLKDLKGLKNLTLNLIGGSNVGSLPLKDLTGLTNLTLNLGSSDVGGLDALKDLTGLKNLTLNLGSNSVGSLDALKHLEALTNLTLNANVSDLSTVHSLGALESLAITNALHYELGVLPKSVTKLTLSDDQGPAKMGRLGQPQ
jgi:transcriptional regulator with XRE-family HTH domain